MDSTKQHGLKEALVQRAGEECPRVIVSRDGRNIGYEELEGLKAEDLSNCQISMFGERVFVDRIPSADKYPMQGGPGGISSSFDQEKSAQRILSQFYTLCYAKITGNW